MNKDEIFCPNCGQKVLKTAHFCGKCGYNIAGYVKNKESKVTTAASQVAQQPTTTKREPTSRKEELLTHQVKAL